MSFNPDNFIESGTFEQFESFKKAQLQVLAEHVGLKIKVSERKQVFRNKLIDFFVGKVRSLMWRSWTKRLK